MENHVTPPPSYHRFRTKISSRSWQRLTPESSAAPTSALACRAQLSAPLAASESSAKARTT